MDTHRRRDRALEVLSAVVHEIRAERLTFMAGSIAYHAFVSLLPTLVLAFTVVLAVGDESLAVALRKFIRAILSPGVGDVLVSQLQGVRGATGLSVVGFAVLLWGTLRIFRGLDTAFSDIYESDDSNTFTDQLSDAVLVLAAIAVAIGFVVVLDSVLRSAIGGSLPWGVDRLVLVVGLTLALYPMYYVFPDTDVGVLEVVPGVLVAAVGLSVFETLFRIYVAYSARNPSSSVVAAVLVLLTWLYVSGLVILFGAVVNAVLSNRSRNVSLPPVVAGPSANEAPPTPDRTELLAAVDRLDRLLEDGEEVVVRVDDESVSLPRPGSVSTEVKEAGLLLGTGHVGVELTWSPRD